jgi:hypothetical protein
LPLQEESVFHLCASVAKIQSRLAGQAWSN